MKGSHRFLAGLAVGSLLFLTAATISRVTTFSDGDILFASDLNAEFNNIVNAVNSLDNDNLAAGANISPTKISASISGDGLSRNGSTGILAVNVDGTTLEISSDSVQVKANGIGNSHLRQSSGVSVIGRSASTTGNVADITAGSNNTVLKRSSDTLSFSAIVSADITDGTIATGDIADGAVTQAKRVALGQQLSSTSGSYSRSSGSFAAVTNHSVSITTTGRPVFVGFVPDGTSSACSVDYLHSTAYDNGAIRLVEASTEFARVQVGGGPTSGTRVNVPCSSIWSIHVTSAGSKTYTSEAAAGSSGTIFVNNAKLIAYEL